MIPLQQAITFNNEGVQLLNSGNIPGALHAFQTALVTMKAAAACHSELIPRTVLQNDQDDRLLSVLGQQSGSLDGLQNEHCYIYDRPILIPTDMEVLCQGDLDSFVLTASTFVIFNFALTYHQQSKFSGHEGPLRRAGQLYSLTLKTLASVESNKDLHAVLQCLSLNNLAQLYYDQCEYRKSQSCLEMLHELVIATDCIKDYLDETEAEEIMLNLVYLQPPTAARAA